ncbi:hypothetical protein ACWERY_16085 [Streptomyces sp. NPDC004082]
MTSAADELRTAATKLRTLVTNLRDCRGPWYVVNREQRPYPQRIDNIGVPYVVATTHTDPSHPPTMADYIAAMHPGVGTALATLLEAVAANPDDPGVREGTARHIGCDPATCPATAALAVARAINGSEHP